MKQNGNVVTMNRKKSLISGETDLTGKALRKT
jgi:hypothetical protein